MSKAKSPSRSRSRSGSRSRSRSFSRSRSQSRSRSRSRKHRYSSRSRSRSRSHSPAHNRDRDYPREYQNNRQFRGYHRGFRRPYYYRGRGRGYFPRGRYQRGGGGGGYNNNYRPNNWQNYRQHPQQQQPPPPPHHPHSPRRGRSRSRTPKKRSGSPRSRSRSRYSDRSSSGRSRRSHRSSSSSSSRSSSPRRPRRQRRRSGSGSGSAKDKEKESSKEKRGSLKDAKERSASKEAAARAGSGSRSGSATGGAEPDPEGGAGGAPGEDGNAPERPGSGNWQGLTDYSASPKRASPQLRSAVVSVPGQPSPTPKSSGSSTNSAVPWHGGGTAPPAQSPKQKSPTAAFSGFGFFSKEDHRAGDKSAISAAFKKFLEEHKNKKQVAEWENGRDKEPGDAADGEPAKGPAFDRAPGYGAPKEKEKYSKYGAGFETGGGGAGGGFLKAAPPFLCAEEEEEDEEVEKMAAARRPPKPRKDREADQPQVKLSTRELFEERFGKWDDLAYFPSGKERPRKAPEGEGEEPDEAEEELYRARKQERAKKEALFRGFSPDKAPQKTRKKEPPGLSPSPPAAPRRGGGSDTRDRDTFLVHRDGSPVRASAKRGGDLAVRMESFRDDAASSSGVLVTERRLSRDLVHPSKKEQEFRSIFQHIQNTQLCRSPSELFAQHIVNIVHQIKAQHFPSSGLTLNERFALYQRRAAEKEMAKPRKSPEIHRRIDVSPSAFKKHSQSHLFDDMKASGDGGYKDDRKRGMKGEAVDLRLDIERRKKYSGKEAEHRREPGRDSADSQGSSRERSGEKYSKHHKKSKKSKKKRERSRSSSASSSSSPSHRAGPGDFLHEDMEPKEEGGFNKARLGPREFGGPMERGRARGGFQFRIRGRGWNRGSYPGNNSNGNPPNMGPVPTHPKSEDWDPEYTPKSRKYYLVGYKREVEDQSTHDDREGEGEKKWLDNRGRGRGNFLRGRGRFILRKAPPTSNSPKWTHDKFQGSGEEGELRDDDSEQDHKEEDKAEQ